MIPAFLAKLMSSSWQSHHLLMANILKHSTHYIKPGTIVACMPARSGGDILFASKMKEKADSLAFVGFETLPWACRFTEWGKRATILGTKGQILAAVTPETESTRAIATFARLCWVSTLPLKRVPTTWALA